MSANARVRCDTSGWSELSLTHLDDGTRQKILTRQAAVRDYFHYVPLRTIASQYGLVPSEVLRLAQRCTRADERIFPLCWLKPMYLKFKLVHAAGKSFFLTDGLIDDSSIEPLWYTPQFFSPPILQFVDSDASARLSIDFVGGQRTLVRFHKSDSVSVQPDGAFLSACTVENPQSLRNAASVRCVLTEGTVWLWLFHHTKPQWRDAILESGHFRASTWNLQGTRQLQNISYLYLTCKPHIRCDQDLADIAMASDGALRFLRDGGEAPQDILTLVVYRDSTLDRDATLPVLVPSHSLSSPPLWFHPRRAGNAAYYEVVQPAVHRVGTRPGSVFPYSDSRLGSSGEDKAFAYAVVGDASTDYGIAAPYDEEETRHIMQLESPPQGWDVFDMWKALANLTDAIRFRDGLAVAP